MEPTARLSSIQDDIPVSSEVRELESKLEALDGRDLYLWSVAVLVAVIVSAGFLALAVPQLRSGTFEVSTRYLPALFFGFVVLVILVNLYLLEQRLGLKRSRLELIRQLIRSEAAELMAQIDPLTWRFHLRAGVHFHDGSLFTAEDAVFSFERALMPPSQRQFVLKGVKRVRVVDPLTIDFELSEPDASLPQKLELVAMMNKRWAQQHHVERAQDFNARQETFAVRNANGTGAYRLERYEPDVRTTLKAFPQW